MSIKKIEYLWDNPAFARFSHTLSGKGSETLLGLGAYTD